MSGTIVVIDADQASEEERTRPTGRRFPRPHQQRLETEHATRFATGSVPPHPPEDVDFDDAITQVNTPRPERPRSTTS